MFSSAGNKLTAYGGNLTVFHRSLFSGNSVEDSEVHRMDIYVDV